MRWADVRPDDIERVKAISERRLTREEWDTYVNQPVTADEERQVHELLSWFSHRYPTPADRLRYARRAYRQWARRLIQD